MSYARPGDCAWEELSCIERVEAGNALAIEIGEMRGYHVPPETKIYRSDHPREREFWSLACKAFDFFLDVDLDLELEIMDDAHN
jgi:hypothetical protein